MLTGFRSVPKTGVIYVMAEAKKKGYRAFASDWSNLGQGQPEIGDIEGAPARTRHIDIVIGIVTDIGIVVGAQPNIT